MVSGPDSRPADVLILVRAFDVSVISTLQPCTVAGAALFKGHALRVGNERKRADHKANCEAAGILFFFLIVKSL